MKSKKFKSNIFGAARNDFGPANLPWSAGGRNPNLEEEIQKVQKKKHPKTSNKLEDFCHNCGVQLTKVDKSVNYDLCNKCVNEKPI